MEWADRHRLRPSLADALWGVISQLDNTQRQWMFDNLKEGSGGA